MHSLTRAGQRKMRYGPDDRQSTNVQYDCLGQQGNTQDFSTCQSALREVFDAIKQKIIDPSWSLQNQDAAGVALADRFQKMVDAFQKQEQQQESPVHKILHGFSLVGKPSQIDRAANFITEVPTLWEQASKAGSDGK
jgi:hypothetical protein